MVKRITSILLSIILFTSSFAGAADPGLVNDAVNIDLKDYYNYYFFNKAEFSSYRVVLLNYTDSDSYFKPKYYELDIPNKDILELPNGSKIRLDYSLTDMHQTPVNKEDITTTRALEKLGYDYLLYRDSRDSKVRGDKNPIDVPYFIMNIYKALGKNIYDFYYMFNNDTGDMFTYISRTNVDNYWAMFLNDHPINVDVYNDYNVESTIDTPTLTVADAILILAEMLDFYGEPVISEQEENMLLQVYAADAPTDLGDRYKDAWSYLKCRGIIGEKEYSYSSNITFDEMMELILRAADKDSRTNFKEVQITTSLESSFIQQGYFSQSVDIENVPDVQPESVSYDFSNVNRIDFLVETNYDIQFRFSDTGKLNRSIFISDGPNHYDEPIKGSVYEGIVDNRFYHFSVPYSELQGVNKLYINSNKGGDTPLNYTLPTATGGVYSDYKVSDSYVTYGNPISFSSAMPSSMYCDLDRKVSNVRTIQAASKNVNLVANFDTEVVDIEKSGDVIKSKFNGTITKGDGNKFTVTVPADSPNKYISSKNDYASIIGRSLVIKDEYVYKSSIATESIIQLTGEGLLVDLNAIKDAKLIKGFKAVPDEESLIIYTNNNDIVIVDDKNNTIQCGNTYLQLREAVPLFIAKNGSYTVDFRALFGLRDVGFTITPGSTGMTVKFYDNAVNNGVHRVGQYTYLTTEQTTPYTDSVTAGKINNSSTNLVVEYADDGATIQEAYLPMVSNNPFGNYILYGVYNTSKAIEEYYIIRFSPKDINNRGNQSGVDMKVEDIFWYKPEKINDNYAISIQRVSSSTQNSLGFKHIDGVGWCYTLKKTNDVSSMSNYFQSYRNTSSSDFLPFSVMANVDVSNVSTSMLLNYNYNYLGKETLSMQKPTTKSLSNVVPAPIALQSWFTNPKLVPTLSMDTVIDYGSSSKMPYVYYGTMNVSVNKDSKSLVMKLSNDEFDISTNTSDNSTLIGINRVSKGSVNPDTSYRNPGAYSIVNKDFAVTFNTPSVNDASRNEKLIALQEFFDQFKEITFKDFIQGLDNMMSILYYVMTRVVPLIILCLLVLVLLLSMVADIKIVQLFCEKVFDPVYIITFGHFNIQTINNRHLILSLIIALTLMGIIQAGNLEKIIMWAIEWFYAIADLLA